jgi:hypothetical protein
MMDMALPRSAEELDDSRGGAYMDVEPMQFRGASVSSKGNFSATFRVPGMVSIPSDGEAHNFTIVQLSLKAEMSWVCVPKADTKAHINVSVSFSVLSR